jgi:putative chitinase
VSSLNRSALEAEVLYRQTFENVDQLEPYGILRSALRLEHFLAQVLHETGGLRFLVENLNYSAQRLTEVWPARFPTLDAAQPFAHNSAALANKTYGGRMGNVSSNDGWRYIGRGLLQLTGRDNYARVGAALGVELVSFPTLVLDPEYGLRVAGEVWWSGQCNIFADGNELESVTRAINGGLIGLEERRAWLKKVRDNHVVNK